jgi:hypothetical protein
MPTTTTALMAPTTAALGSSRARAVHVGVCSFVLRRPDSEVVVGSHLGARPGCSWHQGLLCRALCAAIAALTPTTAYSATTVVSCVHGAQASYQYGMPYEGSSMTALAATPSMGVPLHQLRFPLSPSPIPTWTLGSSAPVYTMSPP